MSTRNRKARLSLVAGLTAISVSLTGQAQAIELREAVQAALNNNPEINQAARNREAVEFERRQAQGLYGPRVSVEASAGIRRLENATRRALGISDDTLYPIEGDILAEQVLVDFGRNRAELSRQASRARLTEAVEERENAAIAFHRVAGVPIGDATMPPDVSASLPPNLENAVDTARMNSPRVLEALADLDAASSQIRAAEAELAPRLSAEGRVRLGDDIDGFRGRTEDYLARLVLRWTIFSSGINQARVREAVSREGEQRSRVHQAGRDAEADVRTAWNRLESQTRLVGELEQQSRVSDALLLSYREQFNVGRRSLLDVLDAQNTRYNVQVQAETARLAQLYAQYRVLASTNRLIEALGVQPLAAATSNARERYRVRTNDPAQVMEPRIPYGPVNN